MFSIIGIRKIKDKSALARRCSHHLRAHEVPNADPDLLHKNATDFKGSPSSLASLIFDKVASLVKRKDAVRCIEVMLSASPEWFESPNAQGQGDRILTKFGLQFLKNTFGADNIQAIGLHLDEKTPHIWALITPIVGGRLCASYWLDGPKKLAALHTAWAAVMSPFGLTRGVEKSGAKHIDIKTYYAAASGSAVANLKIQHELNRRISLSTSRAKKISDEIDELESLYIEKKRALSALSFVSAVAP